MQDNLKAGLKLFVRIVIANILSAIVVLSVIAISVSAFADEIGYDVYGVKGESGETELLYRHYYADGDDTKLEDFETDGYTVTKKIIKQTNPTEHNITVIVAQIFALGVTITYIYPVMWDRGFKDLNFVKTENMVPDKLKGIKIGLIGQVPAFLLFLIFVISPKLPTALFKLLNSSCYGLFEAVFGKSETFGKLSPLQIIISLLILLIIPLISWGSYALGYKDVDPLEKLTYKKKKGAN